MQITYTNDNLFATTIKVPKPVKKPGISSADLHTALRLFMQAACSEGFTYSLCIQPLQDTYPFISAATRVRAVRSIRNG
jgi:hypothetical protein